MQNLTFWLGDGLGNFAKVAPPDNWESFTVDLSFENQTPEATLNTTKLVWKVDIFNNTLTGLGMNGASWMNLWTLGGTVPTSAGNYGIFEGIPLRIYICNDSVSMGTLLFDGICDLTDPDTIFNCDIVSVKIRDKRMDLFTQLLSSVGYDFLATATVNGGPQGALAGPYTDRNGNHGTWIDDNPFYAGGDYVSVAYQQTEPVDFIVVLCLAETIYKALKMTIDNIKIVIEAIEGPIVIVGSTPPYTGGAAAFSTSSAIHALEMIYEIVQLYDMIAQFTYEVCPPTYTKYGMYARTLCERACSFFNFGFNSSIITDPASPYYNLVIIPQKQAWVSNQNGTAQVLANTLSALAFSSSNGTATGRMIFDDDFNFNNGGYAYGYPDMNPADLFRELCTMFNAKLKIILPVSGQPQIYMERWDYQYDISTFVLPNISDQAPFKIGFGTNASELAATYSVEWSTDSSDYQTLNVYDGTTCFYQVQPKNVTTYGVQHWTMGENGNGLNERIIGFSQGVRKNQLTVFEQILSTIGTVILAGALIVASVSIAAVLVVNLVSAIASASVPVIVEDALLLALLVVVLTLLLSNYPVPHFVSDVLSISAHTFSTPKAVIVNTSPFTIPLQSAVGFTPSAFNNYKRGGASAFQLAPDNHVDGDMLSGGDRLSARNLMKYFHFSSLPLYQTPPLARFAAPYPTGTPYYNQWLTYTNQQAPMCCADITSLINTNFFMAWDGSGPYKVDSCKYNPFTGISNIDYRLRKQYSNNLLYSFTVDGANNVNTL